MMEFVYKNWEWFCQKLKDQNLIGVTAADVFHGVAGDHYIVLKHDVETKVSHAYAIAKLEHQYGHRGSYYVQAYLLKNDKNVDLLRKIRDMGHEVSYHYDVLDHCKGDFDCALAEFQKNVVLFQRNGFDIITLCQHGNPILERKGYASNRDFFRNAMTQTLYPNLTDIMVDFKRKAGTEYQYISDAGRAFKCIFDPINNDIVHSDEKNIAIKSFDELIEYAKRQNAIISIHPHRWVKYIWLYKLRNVLFKILKTLVKFAYHIPGINKLINKYYFLAKKI